MMRGVVILSHTCIAVGCSLGEPGDRDREAYRVREICEVRCADAWMRASRLRRARQPTRLIQAGRSLARNALKLKCTHGRFALCLCVSLWNLCWTVRLSRLSRRARVNDDRDRVYRCTHTDRQSRRGCTEMSQEM